MENEKVCRVCENNHKIPNTPCAELIKLEQGLDQLVLQAKVQRNERNSERIRTCLDQTRLIIQDLKDHEHKEWPNATGPKLSFQKQSQTPLQRKLEELISRATTGEVLWMSLTPKSESEVASRQ